MRTRPSTLSGFEGRKVDLALAAGRAAACGAVGAGLSAGARGQVAVHVEFVDVETEAEGEGSNCLTSSRSAILDSPKAVFKARSAVFFARLACRLPARGDGGLIGSAGLAFRSRAPANLARPRVSGSSVVGDWGGDFPLESGVAGPGVEVQGEIADAQGFGRASIPATAALAARVLPGLERLAARVRVSPLAVPSLEIQEGAARSVRSGPGRKPPWRRESELFHMEASGAGFLQAPGGKIEIGEPAGLACRFVPVFQLGVAQVHPGDVELQGVAGCFSAAGFSASRRRRGRRY